MTVGERIAMIRQSRGLSQEDVSKMVDISRQAIYKYEKGIITNIPLDRIEALAKALQVTPAYIMGWEGDNTGINNGIIGCPNSNNTIYNDASAPPILRAIIDTVRGLSDRDAIKVLELATKLSKKEK